MQGVGGQDGNYAHNDSCATTPKHAPFEPRPGADSVGSHLFSAPIILPLQNSTVLLRTLFKL